MLEKAAALRAIEEDLLKNQSDTREQFDEFNERKNQSERSETLQLIETKRKKESEKVVLNYNPFNERNRKLCEKIIKDAQKYGFFNKSKDDVWCIGDEFLPALIEEVNKIKNLTIFWYPSNIYSSDSVSDKGIIFLAENIQKSIVVFDLSYHDMKDSGLRALLQRNNVRRLYIRGALITDAGMNLLSDNTSLVALDITDCHKLTDKSGEYLAKNTSITSLKIAKCFPESELQLKDDFFKNLSRNKSLRTLNCDGTDISDQTAITLSRIPSLTCIDVSNCSSLTKAGILALLNTTERRKKECAEFSNAKFQFLLGLREPPSKLTLDAPSSLLTFSQDKLFEPRLIKEIFSFCDDTSTKSLDVTYSSRKPGGRQ